MVAPSTGSHCLSFHAVNSPWELAIERQLNMAVGANLFDEQPPYLNSFFRFQLGSNTFDGLSPFFFLSFPFSSPCWDPSSCLVAMAS
jgi:hypothetical protein